MRAVLGRIQEAQAPLNIFLASQGGTRRAENRRECLVSINQPARGFIIGKGATEKRELEIPEIALMQAEIWRDDAGMLPSRSDLLAERR